MKLEKLKQLQVKYVPNLEEPNYQMNHDGKEKNETKRAKSTRSQFSTSSLTF